MKRFYILAGDREQARTLANRMNLGASEWGYIASPESLQGIRDQVILTYGTWKSRKDLIEVMGMARLRDMTILYIDD